MNKVFIGLVIAVAVIGGGILVIGSNIQNSSSSEEPQYKSLFNNSIEKCNQLRDSGFFAGAGLPAGSSDPNSREDQQNMYQNCLNKIP